MNREPVLYHRWWCVWRFGFVSPLWLIQTWVRTQSHSVNTLPGVAHVLRPACSVHAAGSQRPLQLEGYFWTFSHHKGLRLMFGLTVRKRVLSGTFQIFFLANSGPHSPVSSKWKLFVCGIFSEFYLFLPHGIAHSNKGVVGWFPELYIDLGSIVLSLDVSDVLYLYLYFLKSVVWGWEIFLDSLLDDIFFGASCFIHSSWKISVNLLIYRCISQMPQKHF